MRFRTSSNISTHYYVYVLIIFLRFDEHICVYTKYSASQIVDKVLEKSAGVDTHFFFAKVVDIANDQSILQVSAFRFSECAYAVFYKPRPSDSDYIALGSIPTAPKRQ